MTPKEEPALGSIADSLLPIVGAISRAHDVVYPLEVVPGSEDVLQESVERRAVPLVRLERREIVADSIAVYLRRESKRSSETPVATCCPRLALPRSNA